MICRKQIILCNLVLFGLSIFTLGQTKDELQYSCNDMDIITLIEELQSNYNLVFAYDAASLVDLRISKEVKGQNPKELLEALFIDMPLELEFLSDNYVVLKVNHNKKVEVHLKGKVMDAANNSPLPMATIKMGEVGISIHSDVQGSFEYRGKLPYNVLVHITYIGYAGKTFELQNLRSDTSLQITLHPANILLNQVVIKAFTLDMLTISGMCNELVFTPEEIPTLPGWGEPDVLRSLQLIPGVSSANESGADLNIRGGYADQNLILWDDIPIYHTGHFFGVYSFINPYVVKSVKLYRGNFDAQYGGRVSGVIDIAGKSDKIKKVKGGGGLNFINAHSHIILPLLNKKASLLIAGRRSFTDFFNSTTYEKLFTNVFQKGRVSSDLADVGDERGIEVFPRFFYADANLKFNWEINSKNLLAISSYIGKDEFNYRLLQGDGYKQDDQVKIGNAGASVSFQHLWGDKAKTKVVGVISKFNNDYYHAQEVFESGSLNATGYLFESGFNDINLKIHQSFAINSKNRLLLGLKLKRQILSSNYVSDVDDEAPWYERTFGYTTTFYLVYKYNPHPHIKVNASMRYDRFKSNEPLESPAVFRRPLQPRFSASWNPGKSGFTFRTAVGAYNQYIYEIPSIYHNLGIRENNWVMANDYFLPLYAWQASVGTVYKKKHFTLEIEYYYKFIRNISTYKLDLEDNLENPLLQNGLSRNTGMDVLMKYKWKKYSTWLSYSLAMSQQRYESFNDAIYFPTEQDERHRLNFTHMLNLKHWDISLSWLLNTGKPFTRAVGVKRIMSDDIGEEFVVDYDRVYNDRVPAYHRLDIAVNYKFKASRFKGKMGLSLYNVYDRRNYFDVDYAVMPVFDNHNNITGRRLQEYKKEMLRFTPNLFVQIEW